MVYSVKMINAPRVPTIGNTGYQMYQTTDGDRTDVPSRYGPIIVPNNFADLFFEKAVIEVLGSTEIEPSTQMHQTTKIIQVYTTVKPEALGLGEDNTPTKRVPRWRIGERPVMG